MDARKLLEEAVAYARSIGFQPHADYLTALRLFGDVAAADSQATFEFGKDGKPFFESGPYDTPERCRRIITTLTNTCGPGNFDFMVGLRGDAGPDEIGFEDEFDYEPVDYDGNEA